jgi:hypothetical protein
VHLVEFFKGVTNISCACIVYNQYIIDVSVIVYDRNIFKISAIDVCSRCCINASARIAEVGAPIAEASFCLYHIPLCSIYIILF